MNNFNLKKFLVENKLTTNSKLQEKETSNIPLEFDETVNFPYKEGTYSYGFGATDYGEMEKLVAMTATYTAKSGGTLELYLQIMNDYDDPDIDGEDVEVEDMSEDFISEEEVNEIKEFTAQLYIKLVEKFSREIGDILYDEYEDEDEDEDY